MQIPDWFLSILRCPETSKPLRYENEIFMRGDGISYKTIDGIPSLVFPKDLAGLDKDWNLFYNLFAPLYDWNERFFGKLLTGVDVVEGRKEIISLLGLQKGMRVLEVSPGPGVFQELIREKIGSEGEFVSVDLSLGMLKQCQKKQSKVNTILLQANGSYLPFAENSFDALFHFGGINLFTETDKAIQEFIRVVKKDGIVSWGDEGFSPKLPDNFKNRILVKTNPGFLKPHPVIPDSIASVQVSEVYGGYAYLVVGKKR